MCNTGAASLVSRSHCWRRIVEFGTPSSSVRVRNPNWYGIAELHHGVHFNRVVPGSDVRNFTRDVLGPDVAVVEAVSVIVNQGQGLQRDA